MGSCEAGVMLISLCIPVMNRLPDVKRALPTWIEAVIESPPAEIVVLDYNSSDGLDDVIRRLDLNIITFNRYIGRAYYHKAHAWNLAFRCSAGEYVTFMGADAVLGRYYVKEVRKLIEGGAVWMRGRHYKGIVCVERAEFEAAGGYDERMEYSGEDKELEDRLKRRGAPFSLVPDGMVRTIRTPNAIKFANSRGQITKAEAVAHGAAIRAENAANGLLVANQGQEWGAW